MNEYDADILEWSEHQAALLRRAAAGERVNGLDWPNIIEEIESVGLSELRTVRSLLLQALLHDLKAEAWPLSISVSHWRSEAKIARVNAADAYVPSMRQRIDVPRLYAQALRVMPETIDGLAPLPVSDVCMATLEDLLSDA